MSSAAVRDVTPAPAARRRRPRVLVLRSCRPAQFAAAVADVRRRIPDAEIVALTHRAHRESLLSAGVDAIVEIGGPRFGLRRTSPPSLRPCRRGPSAGP